MNLTFSNPATNQDIMLAMQQMLSGAVIPPPGGTAVSSPSTGSTTQTYLVVAKSNGAVIPSAAFSTTTGPTTLSASAFNTLSWNMSSVVPNLTWDVYRTAGGPNQGKIAVGLQGTILTMVDTGISADGTTPPTFNTTGFQPGDNYGQFLTGSSDAITAAQGNVIINSTGVDATTINAPIAGPQSAGGMDWCLLDVTSLTAQAHTITASSNCLNGTTYHKVTFTAAALNRVRLVAYNGIWYVTINTGGTLS